MWFRLLCLALFATGSASAEQVLRVKDGDTIAVDSGGLEVDIPPCRYRCTGVRPAPWRGGPRRFLQSLIEGQEAELALVGGDAYRRIVARVHSAGIDVNAEMVRRGLAWVTP